VRHKGKDGVVQAIWA